MSSTPAGSGSGGGRPTGRLARTWRCGARVHEDGRVVVATGEGRGASVDHGPFRFAFNDLFTFRAGRIARVDSYVVPLP
ncbi:hypothetical protein AB0H57_19310 [Micromonospora sp. NPDC050686]|uniref:hypothetical protein n=1 Tax=Micromonospora sp. NPDC050686 TaxID=3154631 RepID=UPI0033D55F8F